MNNNLMMFEGNDVEVFELNGHVLFNPKHVAKVLGIKNVNDNLRKMNKSQVVKVKNSEVGNADIRKLPAKISLPKVAFINLSLQVESQKPRNFQIGLQTKFCLQFVRQADM